MSEKQRKHYGAGSKVFAFILLMLGMILVPVCIWGTMSMHQMGAYLVDSETLRDNLMEEKMSEVALETLYQYVQFGQQEAIQYAAKQGCTYVIWLDGKRISGTSESDYVWSGDFRFNEYDAGNRVFRGIKDYSVQIYVLRSYRAVDIWWTISVAQNSELLKVLLPVLIVSGVVLAIVSFVFLLKAIGWTPQQEQVTSGRFGRIPADVFTLLILLLGAGWNYLLGRLFSEKYVMVQNICLFYGWFILGIVWLLSIVARKKAGTLYYNTLIEKIIKVLKCGIIVLGKAIIKLPLIWKTAFGLVILCLLEGIVLFICFKLWKNGASQWILLIGWGLEKLLLVPFVLYVAMKLRALKLAGNALAEGNLTYQVNEDKFFWDLKEHASALNRISEGVNIAVRERMKSEHFKTELITNVSHDIKTPLTSIINYSDLLAKEETDNEKIRECAEVLQRQSGRLKKLIEDLVEASKASTGSMEVKLEECEIGVLLEQAVGEFAEKLYEKNMDVITKNSPEPLKIMADGRLMWRVFDNLLNNICKYAQSGTRVYLSVEKEQNQAVVTFKNMSEYPLDITEEELMERFVRGDKSRHTEGNGLGLNIAKSLVELQNGSMKLVIDGDLFKVILSFPTID